jgi:hypothetical protein
MSDLNKKEIVGAHEPVPRSFVSKSIVSNERLPSVRIGDPERHLQMVRVLLDCKYTDFNSERSFGLSDYLDIQLANCIGRCAGFCISFPDLVSLFVGEIPVAQTGRQWPMT